MLVLALENKMKVKQIVSEHKKGYKANIYQKKKTIQTYGPGAHDGKLKPVKPLSENPVNVQVKPVMGAQEVDVNGQKIATTTDATSAATLAQLAKDGKVVPNTSTTNPNNPASTGTTMEEDPVSGAIAQVNTKSNPPMVIDNATGGSPLGMTKTGEEITPELIARSTDWQERSIQANGKTYTALYSGTRGYRVGRRAYQEITRQSSFPSAQLEPRRSLRESQELDAIKRLSGL